MAPGSTPPGQDASGPTEHGRPWLARRPVLAYAILAYAVTWSLWLPYFLSQAGLGLLPVTLPNLLLLLGQYGPTVAAFAMAAATGGGQGARRLMGRYGLWRVNVGWYLLVICGPLVLLVVVLLGWVGVAPLWALGPDGPSLVLEYLVFVAVLKLVLGGALGEEAGWRGFALPRLQARYGAMRASLILGAIWVAWHAPLYLDPARVVQNPPVPFAVGVLAVAVIYTWVYNRTGGSLPIAILLHSAFNSAPPVVRDLVPGLGASEFFNLVIAGYVAATLLTIAATRGQLGYRPDTSVSPVDAPSPVAW